MLRIRFKRAGKKNQPAYRLVVSERTRTPFAKAKEDIGWYNPHSKEAGIDADRAKYWLSVGAQPSDTVHNLFIKQGIMEGKKIAVHSQSKKEDVEDSSKEQAEKPKAEAAGNEVGDKTEAAESEGNEVGVVNEVGDKTEAAESEGNAVGDGAEQASTDPDGTNDSSDESTSDPSTHSTGSGQASSGQDGTSENKES
ncbi:MAG: 30S ribosomal protein S16 [bacterium]|nr:30S ribosomal protein S16 [bacterium]